MISLDISILYQIVIFVALWLILSKVLFRPYVGLLDARERQTGGARYDTGELEHEGVRLKAEYEEKMDQARSAAVAVKDVIVQEARQERERLLHNAREEAARKLDSVRREVQSQLEKERTLLPAEVAAVAQDMASKVLGRRVG
jgi:F-type H+-transporting ATPase subunit b